MKIKCVFIPNKLLSFLVDCNTSTCWEEVKNIFNVTIKKENLLNNRGETKKKVLFILN